MKQKVILSLEWTSYPSRDTETATLVRNYLRLNGIKVISGSVHNAYALLRRHKVDLVYMTNIIGAKINFEIACYCRSKNIKLVTGISEGGINDHEVTQMVWGHNSLRFPIESDILLWSRYDRQKFVEEHHLYNSIAQVTGSPGADRYKFCAPNGKRIDRSRYKLVVGVGCFSFPVQHDSVEEASNENSDSFFRLSVDRDAFADTLDELVLEMPEVLFLLKMHPGELRGEYGAGIEKAAQHENAKVLPKDASIFNCISASDVWLTYESNTAMEAWLMNKPTGLLNPTGTNFPRSDFYKGQPNFASAIEWRDALHNYLQYGELPGFNELENERNRIIKKLIGWDDGFNHVRSGNAIIEALNSDQLIPITEIPRYMIPSLMQRIKQSFNFISAQTGVVKAQRRKWDNAELRKFEAHRMEEQIQFYVRLGDDWRNKLKKI